MPQACTLPTGAKALPEPPPALVEAPGALRSTRLEPPEAERATVVPARWRRGTGYKLRG